MAFAYMAIMKAIIFSLFIILFLNACSVNLPKTELMENREIQGFGFVLEKEGCYLLQTATEEFYPVNLEEALLIDGLRVKFTYTHITSQLPHNCAQFKPVEIKEIIPYRK